TDRFVVPVNDDGKLDVVQKSSSAVFHGVGALEDGGDVGDEYNYCPPADDSVLTSCLRQGFGVARPGSVPPVSAGPLGGIFRIDLELRLPAEAASDRRS